jgi:hypothetical protein
VDEGSTLANDNVASIRGEGGGWGGGWEIERIKRESQKERTKLGEQKVEREKVARRKDATKVLKTHLLQSFPGPP